MQNYQQPDARGHHAEAAHVHAIHVHVGGEPENIRPRERNDYAEGARNDETIPTQHRFQRDVH